VLQSLLFFRISKSKQNLSAKNLQAASILKCGLFQTKKIGSLLAPVFVNPYLESN